MRTQPHKGYSTKAWNPPMKWVSPERIALAGISAVPQPATLKFLQHNQYADKDRTWYA